MTPLNLFAHSAARRIGRPQDAEAIQKIVEHNRAAVGKIQVRADERVVELKVRQPDGGMK